jgi:hypothetical protein
LAREEQREKPRGWKKEEQRLTKETSKTGKEEGVLAGEFFLKRALNIIYFHHRPRSQLTFT